MSEQIAPGTAIVNSKELGTNCWSPCRFIRDDGRCERVFTCSYPEKATCQAIDAEVCYLVGKQAQLLVSYANIDRTIRDLQKMVEK